MRGKSIVLAVGAHPDDIEFGCGGALAKHIELGDTVYGIVMTNGERGKHKTDRRECLSSLKRLGVKEVFFGNFPDGSLTDDCSTVNFIEEFITKLGVTRVYTHTPNDRHQDHRACSRSVSSASRKITEILLFQGPSTLFFEPHYFIQLSDNNFTKKLASIRCYKTQIKKGTINPKIVKNLAEIYGTSCNKKYAEAFAVNHLFREESDV